jgi:predicted Zn-dependent protease
MRQSEGGDYVMDPGLTSYVQQVGQRLAAVSDRKLPYEFTVLNNSIPNAWALPGGKIAVNRGLLTQLKSESELSAVLGHEIVHAAARHSAQQMSRGMLLQGGLIAAQVAASDSDYGSIYTAGAGIAAQLLMQRYGREAELEADKYGIEYMRRAGYDANGAVSLQETFVRMNDRKDSGWLAGLFASHPPSQERLDANRQRVAKLPPGGDLGVERFNAAMAQTMRAKPAYDAYDEGRKALAGSCGRRACKASRPSSCCRAGAFPRAEGRRLPGAEELPRGDAGLHGGTLTQRRVLLLPPATGPDRRARAQ